MTKRKLRRLAVGSVSTGLLTIVVASMLIPKSYCNRDVPVFRAYASNHLTTAMGFMPCSEATPVVTHADWCSYYYHRLMHRVWLLAAETKGESEIVIGKKYEF